MRDRVGSGLDRPTERKGGETVKSAAVDRELLKVACRQLWNWVGNEKYQAAAFWVAEWLPSIREYGKGQHAAYANVRLYMRKFFAGLIDFEDGEKDETEKLR